MSDPDIIRLDDPDAIAVPPEARRGRGAISNASGRYETDRRELVDDGWGSAATTDGAAPFRTTVTRDASRTIITRNQSPDLGFDRSINPYRGCEHGCVYCYARPTHAFLGLSPGLDFETRLFYKPEAADLLARELGRAKYRCRVIAIGTNTDPYQPIERRFAVTRRILEVLDAHNHPVAIVTKSHLVVRDADILGRMAERGLAKVAVSVTTLDRRLARSMEPRASTPARRLASIRVLSRAGVPTGVMFAPVIPALNDQEMDAVLAAARGAGAAEAGYVLLRMPLEIKQLFREWLDEWAPDRAARVIGLMREMRGGRDYDATFSRRMVGTGPYAAMIAKRFEAGCRRLGLNERNLELDTSQFKRPTPPGAPGEQLSLL